MKFPIPTMEADSWKISVSLTLKCRYCQQTKTVEILDIDENEMFRMLESRSTVEQSCQSSACHEKAKLDWYGFVASQHVDRLVYGDSNAKKDLNTWLTQHCPSADHETFATILKQAKERHP